MATAEKTDPSKWKSVVSATNRVKAAGNKAGKQFVAQPKSIAQKAARYR
jgi:hypothetical protein